MNSVHTGCIVKGVAEKSPHFSCDFLGVLDFLRWGLVGLFCRNSRTVYGGNFIKSPIFTNTPYKSIALYKAPILHTVDFYLCMEPAVKTASDKLLEN